jgi:hypothetical protein
LIVKSLIINSLISKSSTINSLTVKQNIDKLVATRSIQRIEEATWLSSIVVMLKNNRKLKICVNFMKLNKGSKNNPSPLPFFDEVLNIVVGFMFRWILRIPSDFYNP